MIDTDTASDDAVALLMALLWPDVQVDAVTVVAGNVPLAQAVTNALVTLDVVGRPDLPVHAGCDRPLVRPLGTAQEVHGADGMGDMGLPVPSRGPTPGHAVDVLRELADGTRTLVTLGPLTNVAAALARDRSVLSRYQRVVCMAGSPDAVGNVTPLGEFNVWADPEATAMVLSAEADITFVGWNISRLRAVMTPERAARLAALDTPLARFVRDINVHVAEFCATVTGLAGYDLPDPIAMAIALDPSIATSVTRHHVSVALDEICRGQTIVDHRLTSEPPNCSVVWDADEEAFFERLFTACAQPVGHWR